MWQCGRPLETTCQIQVGLLHSSKLVWLPLEPQTPFPAGAISQKTRGAHQISAVTLAELQEDAFLSTFKPDTEDAKETWRQEMISRSPKFVSVLGHYPAPWTWPALHPCSSGGELPLVFGMDSMKALVPWFFSMDRHNYARWTPVCKRGGENLPFTIKGEFEQHGLNCVQDHKQILGNPN